MPRRYREWFNNSTDGYRSTPGSFIPLYEILFAILLAGKPDMCFKIRGNFSRAYLSCAKIFLSFSSPLDSISLSSRTRSLYQRQQTNKRILLQDFIFFFFFFSINASRGPRENYCRSFRGKRRDESKCFSNRIEPFLFLYLLRKRKEVLISCKRN